MREIYIKNTSGIFDDVFHFEVVNGANWFTLDGAVSTCGKDKMIIDASYTVKASFKDELGNKYDGILCIDSDPIDSVDAIEENTIYYFIEEDEMF